MVSIKPTSIGGGTSAAADAMLLKSTTKLSEPSWDVICDILYAISDNITFYGKFILCNLFLNTEIFQMCVLN